MAQRDNESQNLNQSNSDLFTPTQAFTEPDNHDVTESEEVIKIRNDKKTKLSISSLLHTYPTKLRDGLVHTSRVLGLPHDGKNDEIKKSHKLIFTIFPKTNCTKYL